MWWLWSWSWSWWQQTNFSRPCPKTGYYDVFLSFRGEDTRYGFTANLYRLLLENKVYTFMDVDLTGEDIDNYLFKMVEKSRIAVVIYSESFASSDWCLRELDLILQRRKEKNMLIIPIFYKVNVHELKHLIGKTAECLDKLIPKHGETTVKKWKDVITKFGNISGLSYKNNDSRNEYDFIMEVMNVIVKIKKKLRKYEETHKRNVRTQDNLTGKIKKGSACHQDIEVYPQLLRQEDNRGSSTQSFKHTNSATGQEDVYNVVTSAYFQKTGERVGELLNIKPLWWVCFYVEKDKPSSSCVILTNTTDDYVAFMIQTTQPLKFSVRPNKGFLLPRSTCQVIVTMEAQSVVSPEMYIDDFVEIQSAKAKNKSYSMDDFSYAFRERPGNTIHNCKMNACYSYARYRHPSVQDHNAELANKGFIQESEGVKSIEMHPTKPWLLLSTSCKSVCIWNYETRVEEKSFLVNDLTIMKYAKLIHAKQWIVVGTNNSFVRVFNYNTLEKVKELKAHEGSTWCVAVHPTLPYLLTSSSSDIKLWNWENDWACDHTFEGNSQEVAFNPKDSTSFATVSLEGIIKIWSFGSSVAQFTIKEGGSIRYCCVEYFVGAHNKLYLLCGSACHGTASVWDYESKTFVQTLKGHSYIVTTTLVPSKLPFIITGSMDKTICIWNKNTHRLELVWNCNLGEIYSMRYIKASDEIVLGCQDGMVVIKIVNTRTQLD